ncbi:MAG: FtsX-like permease family protein [bacterium]|nr:FtsX-like permease family protein [bacterium]
MFQLTRLLGIRHLRNQWLRTLLSLMGIVVGITTFIFAPTIGNTLVASLDMTADDLAGKASIEITTEAGITPDQLAQIRTIDGVSQAVPSASGGGLLIGESELLAFWGIDPAIDRDIRAYTLTDGNFISAQGEALISQRYADNKGIRLNDTITLVGTGGVKSLQVVGILANSGGVARLNGGDIITMTLEDAMIINGKTGADTIHVVPNDSVSVTTLMERLQSALSINFKITQPASHLSNSRNNAMLLNALMGIITLMILSIGSFLIYNATAVSVAQRRGEIGILRALGLEKRHIRRMFMTEAAVMGLIGSILGIIGGYMMLGASGDLEILPKTLISSSPLQSRASFVVPIWLPFLTLFMGILFPLLASYFASKEAIKIDPTEAMIQIRSEAGHMPLRKGRLIFAICIIVGVMIVRFTFNGDFQTGIMLSNIMTYSMLFATVLLIAPLLVALDRLVRWSNQRGWGLSSWLAMLNLTRRPKRILSTGILLSIGGVMFVYTSQINYGFSNFADEWGKTENVGDLTLLGAGVNPLMPLVTIPQAVIDEVLARPDVTNSLAELSSDFESEGKPYKIRAIDIDAFTRFGGQFIWSTGSESGAIADLLDHSMPSILVNLGGGIISNNIVVGNTLSLTTPSGQIDFLIVGTIYGGMGLDETTLIMDKALYTQLWGDTRTNRLTLQLADGADIQTIRRELLRQYAMQGVVVYDVNEILGAFSERLTSVSTVSILFSGLFTIILAVGLGSTFYVLILDRRREIGMLRALGMTQGQIRQSVMQEGLLLFIVTCFITVPGAYLATSIQQMGIQNIMGFKFQLELSEVMIHLGILLILVILAMLAPATIGGKTNVLEAMRYE